MLSASIDYAAQLLARSIVTAMAEPELSAAQEGFARTVGSALIRL
jgi:hypothetical protein